MSHEVPGPELDNIDWALVKQHSYYTERGDVLSETNEATVYKRKQLPFVIKVFADPENVTSNIAIADQLEGLVPATIAASDITLRVDNRPVMLESCLVQERLDALDSIQNGVFNADPERLIDIIQEKAELDKEILRRGIFLNDPKFMNYGLDLDGHVKVLDTGGATENPFDSDYLQRFLIRGAGHYFNYFVLQTLFTGRMALPTQRGRDLASVYAETVDLTFDPQVSANDFLTHEPYLFALAKDFGPSLVRLALEDVQKHTSFVLPEGNLLPEMARSSKDNWVTYPEGMVGYISSTP